jgi:beta-lactamase regulating signal transducer with metallopeptidase domain
METLAHAVPVFSAALVSALFSALWEGAVLACCVAMGLRFFPRLSAAARSMVWMNVFLLLVVLHAAPALKGQMDAAGAVNASPIAISLDPRWSLAIAGLWGVLSVLRGTQLVSSAVRLHRMSARAVPFPADPAVLALLEGGANGRRAELCTTDEVERPCVFGFFRPRILIPPVLADKLSQAELAQVVMHEMEHLRRGDDWTNLMQKMGLALFPLNPAMLWVERRLCAERELACDDRVLRAGGARKAYALCLTRLAEYRMLQRSMALVLGAWERQSELMRRVRRVLTTPLEPMGGWHARLVTAGVIAGVLGAAIGLARSPQMVTFAPVARSAAQARGAQAGQIREASLRQPESRDSGAKATLVKAVLPEKPRQIRHAVKRSNANVPKPEAKPEIAPARQAWVVMTTWSEVEAPPQVIFAVERTTRTQYAAVPFGDGWLIIKI